MPVNLCYINSLSIAGYHVWQIVYLHLLWSDFNSLKYIHYYTLNKSPPKLKRYSWWRNAKKSYQNHQLSVTTRDIRWKTVMKLSCLLLFLISYRILLCTDHFHRLSRFISVERNTFWTDKLKLTSKRVLLSSISQEGIMADWKHKRKTIMRY